MSGVLIAVSAATATMIWWVSLALFAVVLVVVALLLHSVLRAANSIHGGVAEIWTVGKQIAGNTVQITALAGINRTAGNIVRAAGGIHDGLRRIEQHAASCTGCPQCMLGGPQPSIGSGEPGGSA